MKAVVVFGLALSLLAACRAAPTGAGHGSAAMPFLTIRLPKSNTHYEMTFSPDDKTLETRDLADMFQYWSVKTGKLQRALFPKVPRKAVPVMGESTRIVYSPDRRMAAVEGSKKDVLLYDIVQGKRISLLRARDKRFFDAEAGDTLSFDPVFSPDGRTLAVPYTDELIGLWNMQTGRIVGVLSVPSNHGATHLDLSFSRDGRTFIAVRGWIYGTQPGLCKDTVTFWDTATWRKKAALPETAGCIRFSALLPDGKTFLEAVNNLTFGGRYEVWRWNITTGRKKRISERDAGAWITGSLLASFSADGKYLGTSAEDGLGDVPSHTASIENLATGKVTDTATIKGIVVNLALSPDGKLLAVVDSEGVVMIWKTAEGRKPGSRKKQYEASNAGFVRLFAIKTQKGQ
jgi:WD40 repeat protein